MHRDADDSDSPQGPWERYWWVMGAIWLVFLIFPLVAAISLDSWWERIASIALLVVFAHVYLLGFIRLPDWGAGGRAQVARLLILIGVTLLLAVFIQWEALSTIPFIVAYSMYALPFRVALVITAAAPVLTIALPWALTGGLVVTWFLGLIGLLVGCVTGMSRIFDERQEYVQRTNDELRLVQDRDRMARDVHDVLGHSLTVISVKAELANRLLDQDTERARHEVAEIQDLARSALADVRSTVTGLRVATLAQECQSAQNALEDASIRPALSGDPAEIDPQHRLVLGWVLREAVTNVIRHSQATSCTIRLAPGAVSITDDGHGLGESQDGNGLSGIRARVEAAGGQVEITSADGTAAGSGVHVCAWFPGQQGDQG